MKFFVFQVMLEQKQIAKNIDIDLENFEELIKIIFKKKKLI